MIVDRLLPNIYKQWERFKRKKNGFYISQVEKNIENRKNTTKFCFDNPKESRFCIELLLALKNGFISIITNRKHHEWIRINHQHRQQNNIINGKKALLRIWWD